MIDLSNLSDLEVLTLTIIGEARGEPIEGQIAVASIIRNRMLHNPKKYPSYKEVCFEHAQFSCWNVDSPEKGFMDDLIEKVINNEDITDKYLIQCMSVAQGVDEGTIIDNTGGNLYYLTNDLYNSEHKPVWSKNARNVIVKGNQTFFNV